MLLWTGMAQIRLLHENYLPLGQSFFSETRKTIVSAASSGLSINFEWRNLGIVRACSVGMAPGYNHTLSTVLNVQIVCIAQKRKFTNVIP